MVAYGIPGVSGYVGQNKMYTPNVPYEGYGTGRGGAKKGFGLGAPNAGFAAALGRTPGENGMNPFDWMINTPGYDYSAQIRAMYDQLQSKGKKIYKKTKGTLTDIYGDLRAEYEPAQENTRVRFDTATTSTANAKAAGDAAEAMRLSAEDAARRDMLAKMGIANQGDTGSGGASVDLAREEGATNREALQNNWAGLMGSLSAAQQGRDASALRGVGDQETMALEELATRWSDYQNQLAQREAQAMQGARGGGGRVINPLLSQMASSNPMVAMFARTQFSNQTGMSPDQINSIFAPKGQAGMTPEQQSWLYSALGEAGAAGIGGVEGFLANRGKSTGLSDADWAAISQYR